MPTTRWKDNKIAVKNKVNIRTYHSRNTNTNKSLQLIIELIKLFNLGCRFINIIAILKNIKSILIWFDIRIIIKGNKIRQGIASQVIEPEKDVKILTAFVMRKDLKGNWVFVKKCLNWPSNIRQSEHNIWGHIKCHYQVGEWANLKA